MIWIMLLTVRTLSSHQRDVTSKTVLPIQELIYLLISYFCSNSYALMTHECICKESIPFLLEKNNKCDINKLLYLEVQKSPKSVISSK